MHLAGKAGLNGWRWIFILEGIMTCLIGIIGYFFIVNFPDDAHKNWNFLDKRETRFVLARVNADRGDAVTEAWSWAKFLRPALDLKTWAFAFIFGMTTTVTYALAYFLPIILHEGMGFSVGASQCLVAPPYAAAALLMYATAWFGDRYKTRGLPLVFNTVLALIGLPLLGFSKNLGARYFGVFLVAMGSNANVPTTLTYQYVFADKADPANAVG
jgi:sugar phosphate permease